MESKFLDLEDKINLVYDYLYNLNTKNCFSFDKILLFLQFLLLSLYAQR